MVLTKVDSSSPLYLSVAAEELRLFGIYELLTEFIRMMPEHVPALYAAVLRRLEAAHGVEVCRAAMSAIVISGGLFEEEAAQIIALAKRQRAGDTRCEANDCGVSMVALPRLWRDAASVMRQQHQVLRGPITLLHAQTRAAVQSRYLSTPQETATAHDMLVSVYQPVAASRGTTSPFFNQSVSAPPISAPSGIEGSSGTCRGAVHSVLGNSTIALFIFRLTGWRLCRMLAVACRTFLIHVQGCWLRVLPLKE